MTESRPESLGSPGASVNASPAGDSQWRRLDALAAALAGGARSACAHLTEWIVRGEGASAALVLTRANDREEYALVGSHGLDDAERRSERLALARRLAAWVETSRLPLEVPDPSRDTRFAEFAELRVPAYATPLGTVPGALVVFDAAANPAATAADRAATLRPALAAGAGMAGLAVAWDRIRNLTESLMRRIDDAERARLRAERLAFVGEMAVATARDVRAPLASLGGIAARLAEETDDADPRHALLEVMVQEVERLNRLFSDQVELADTRDPELKLDDINRLLAECLMLVDADLQRRKLRVTRRLAPSLPTLLLDTGLLRRFFLNLLRAAIERAPEGGRIKVESRRRGEVVEALIAADGAREPGRALDDLWVPFQPESAERVGPSYAAAERILREHRGTLRVVSNSDWPLVFLLTLPIPGNQERRGLGDRRRGNDRRAA